MSAADLFSTFEPDNAGAAGSQQTQQTDGGFFDFNVAGSIDDENKNQTQQSQQAQQTDSQQTNGQQTQQTGGDETVTVKKADWDATQEMLAEWRGFKAANSSQTKQQQQTQQTQQTQQYREPEPDFRQQQAQQQASQAQFDQFVGSLAEDITSLDPQRAKAALQKAISAGAQLGAQAALASQAPATNSTVDLMIENFVTRQASKDPDLYDKIVERFEQKLGQYNTRAFANYSRSDLNAALQELWDAEAGRWARERMIENKSKRGQTQTTQQDPTNYGGGRSSQSNNGGGRTMNIPADWKSFAAGVLGIPENEVTPEMFKDLVS